MIKMGDILREIVAVWEFILKNNNFSFINVSRGTFENEK